MKIRDIVNLAKTNKNNVTNTHINLRQYSIDFSKNIRNLDTAWYSGNIELSIALTNFPEEYVSYLRILCVFKPNTDDALATTYSSETPKWQYLIEKISDTNYILRVNIEAISNGQSKIKISIINPNDAYELRKPKL
jgi:hypothetical protein